MKFVSGKQYVVVITPPKELRNVTDLEYQVTNASNMFTRSAKDNSLIINVDRYFTNVSRYARLCLNDFCGNKYLFEFPTNVGGERRLV